MTGDVGNVETQYFDRLRAKFPPEVVGKLPRVTCPDCSKRSCPKHQKSKCNVCGAYISSAHIHLDYVGHAEVTDRLLSVDPGWSWEPMGVNEQGLPLVSRGADGGSILWIRLTVLGVTRLGVGSVAAAAFDTEKQLIGDALRNAAMRFGVALELWAKEELESDLPAPLTAAKAPPDVDADTGEITGGGERILPAPPAGSTRRPPPGAAPANPPGAAAVPTRPPHGRQVVDVGDEAPTAGSTRRPPPGRVTAIRALASSKGYDDSDLERMADKDFGELETLTPGEAVALLKTVTEAERRQPVPTEFDVLESPLWPPTMWKAYITAEHVGLAALLREGSRLCAEDPTLGAAPTKLSDLPGRDILCQLLAGWVAERGESTDGT